MFGAYIYLMEYVILIDMDNTLSNFNEAAIRYLRNVKGFNGKITKGELAQYDFFRNIFPNLNNKDVDKLYEDMFNWPGFWMSAKPFPASPEIMSRLNKKHNLYIVTKPWKTSLNCIPEKISWIQYYLPFFDLDNVIFCSNKHLIIGDYIIEDSPRYLESTICKNTIAFNYPYNQHIDVTHRVDNWIQIGQLLL